MSRLAKESDSDNAAVEPQWNPMAEEQALDRVHRLGQTREVIATRYIVKSSIEEVSHSDPSHLREVSLTDPVRLANSECKIESNSGIIRRRISQPR